MATHNPDIAHLADRIFRIHEGNLVEESWLKVSDMALIILHSYLTAPLWRLSLRRLRRRPFQTILLVLGVAIGVAMMVSIDLANGSARRAFELSTDAVTGRTTHRIVPADTNGLDEDMYRRLRLELGYTRAAPVVEGYVLVDSLGGQPLRLVGIDPFAEPPFRSYFEGSSRGRICWSDPLFD